MEAEQVPVVPPGRSSIIGIDRGPDESIIRVTSADRPGLFTMVAGVLAAHGLDIMDGSIRTLDDPAVGRMAVDRVRVACADAPDDWPQRLAEDLDYAVRVLSSGEPDAFDRARDWVTRLVAARLADNPGTGGAMALEDLSIEIADDQFDGVSCTRIGLRASDTPMFLFSAGLVLGLHQVSIWAIDIQTHGAVLEDRFYVLDDRGKPLSSRGLEDKVRLSLGVTKQFTAALDSAPDPVTALQRFDRMVEDLAHAAGAAQDSGEPVLAALVAPEFLRSMARLLGTSDFLWEDFIREHHGELLPLSSARGARLLSMEPQDVAAALQGELGAAPSRAAATEALNTFKDRQAFLVDIDHILGTVPDFFFLSSRLSALADAVLDSAFHLAWDEMTEQYGVPRTTGGFAARWAVFGLGKLGGRALGYASDLELLFVYADEGSTDGARPVRNQEFFERMVRDATGRIRARREGIFETDLRLRPHGDSGPLAVRLDHFVGYYGSGGEAHSLERLALVRLRAICGDSELGSQVEQLRDAIVYESRVIEPAAIRELRRKQLELRGSGPRINAKYSPGGLADLEYNVQLLQVIHGAADRRLRTAEIHRALGAMSESGRIDPSEAEAMISAYRFLRRLINGLRMLRGNAGDLEVPDDSDPAFAVLAARIGYPPPGTSDAPHPLRVDLDETRARVRAFVERHLGPDALPPLDEPGIADLLFATQVDREKAASALRKAGFADPERAWRNLSGILRQAGDRQLGGRFLLMAIPVLVRGGEADEALNRLEQLLGRLPDPRELLGRLTSHRRELELLLRIIGASAYLAEVVQRNPDAFGWASAPNQVQRARGVPRLERNLAELAGPTDGWQAAQSVGDGEERAALLARERTRWLNVIRRFRNRELLRIGIRDLVLRVPLLTVAAEISDLAEAILRATLVRLWDRMDRMGQLDGVDPESFAERCTVLAFGKLGARELNYSSDIDLLMVYRAREPGDAGVYERAMREIIADLSDFTPEGSCYRVDIRLRPFGSASPAALAEESLVQYYRESARDWELQALLRCRALAGNRDFGRAVLAQLLSIARVRLSSPDAALPSLVRMRAQARDQAEPGWNVEELARDFDVKNGPGGIREIEFLAQGLLLEHGLLPGQAEDTPGNTIAVLETLSARSLLDPGEAQQLIADYTVLRRLEHSLQLDADRQVHRLPADGPARRRALRAAAVDPGSDDGESAVRELRLRTLAAFSRRAASWQKNAPGGTGGSD